MISFGFFFAGRIQTERDVEVCVHKDVPPGRECRPEETEFSEEGN